MGIPAEEFGQDHWSTFAYLCSAIVGQGGKLRAERMRTDQKRHRHLADPRLTDRTCPPTRLASGRQVFDHDDWDCAEDLVDAGLLESRGSGLFPIFWLTDSGWRLCREIVEARFGDAAISFADFRPKGWAP